ncbi:hypothetical protein GOP47_0018463 [Adiantum capillus-veneris]|uniref:Uncharacterized protein n=1 Tax=Adiantum capillus-veneris TaxID=13818 RepID=A0A9D4UD77_ADICA|nr:hypothetical protein GOP47_0018463 [Adiantum capillus-veneris]
MSVTGPIGSARLAVVKHLNLWPFVTCLEALPPPPHSLPMLPKPAPALFEPDPAYPDVACLAHALPGFTKGIFPRSGLANLSIQTFFLRVAHTKLTKETYIKLQSFSIKAKTSHSKATCPAKSRHRS